MIDLQPVLPGVELFEFPLHDDERGQFSTSFSLGGPESVAARFPIAQVSRSRSRRGAVRGIHVTLTPPGCAKLVRCSVGRALDVVVDLRLGSPTFACVSTIELSADDARVLALPVGVGHGFIAEEEDTVIDYLLSAHYRPEHELAVDWKDPGLAEVLPWPDHAIVSSRDQVALSLDSMRGRGLLPDFEASRRLDEELLARVDPGS